MVQWLRALKAAAVEPGFKSQHPYDSSHRSVIPSSREPDIITETLGQNTSALKKNYLKILYFMCYGVLPTCMPV